MLRRCVLIWYVQIYIYVYIYIYTVYTKRASTINNYKASTSHVKAFEEEERPLAVLVCPDLDKHISRGPEPLLARIELSSVVFPREIRFGFRYCCWCVLRVACRQTGRRGRERVACNRV